MTPMAQVRLTSLRIPEGRPLWLFAVMWTARRSSSAGTVDVLTPTGNSTAVVFITLLENPCPSPNI